MCTTALAAALLFLFATAFTAALRLCFRAFAR